MSLVRLINENGTHIFLNCLNKNVAPGGSITVSSHDVNSNTEILSAIATGAFRQEDLSPPTDEESEEEKDVSEQETVEVEVPKEPPAEEPSPEEPKAEEDKSEEGDEEGEKGYYVHDIDRQPSADSKSFVKARSGVKEGRSLDMSIPPHMIDRFGDPVKEKPEEVENKETIGGVEIINPAPEPPPSEMIDGIEIIDTSNNGAD